MASLKYNGTELARVAYEHTSTKDETVRTHHYSFGSRGWILRRVDMVFLNEGDGGHRVKGGWKRFARWGEEGRTIEQAVANTHEHYNKLGWTEVTG